MIVEIKEGQNIFDAMLASSGSVELGLEFLVVGNDSDVLNWDVETGDVIDTGTDEILDFIVLHSYKRKDTHQRTPKNRRTISTVISTTISTPAAVAVARELERIKSV